MYALSLAKQISLLQFFVPQPAIIGALFWDCLLFLFFPEGVNYCTADCCIYLSSLRRLCI